MKPLLAALFTLTLLPVAARAHPKIQTPFYVSLIDQLSPQLNGPSINGLEERRRGPIFAAALRQVSDAGKLPPMTIINRDLTIPATVPDEPKLPAGARLVRIYLTQWSQTRLGGIADTEVLCRFFVEVRRDGRVEKKLGPFFSRKQYDTVTATTAPEFWAQYQASARLAIEQMATALKVPRER